MGSRHLNPAGMKILRSLLFSIPSSTVVLQENPNFNQQTSPGSIRHQSTLRPDFLNPASDLLNLESDLLNPESDTGRSSQCGSRSLVQLSPRYPITFEARPEGTASTVPILVWSRVYCFSHGSPERYPGHIYPRGQVPRRRFSRGHKSSQLSRTGRPQGHMHDANHPKSARDCELGRC